MGRYSDYATVELTLGPFSVSGGPKSGLGDVYDIDFTTSLAKAGSVTLTASFGPQGRNFDSELFIAGAVEAELEGIGITVGGIKFGSNTVSVDIGEQTFVYTRDQLDTGHCQVNLMCWRKVCRFDLRGHLDGIFVPQIESV